MVAVDLEGQLDEDGDASMSLAAASPNTRKVMNKDTKELRSSKNKKRLRTKVRCMC